MDSIVSPLQLHWVKGVCMFRSNLPPALFCRMTGVFYMPLLQQGVGMDTKQESSQKANSGWLWRRKFSHHSCRDLNFQPFDYESGMLPAELSRPPLWSSLLKKKLNISKLQKHGCECCRFLFGSFCLWQFLARNLWFHAFLQCTKAYKWLLLVRHLWLHAFLQWAKLSNDFQVRHHWLHALLQWAKLANDCFWSGCALLGTILEWNLVLDLWSVHVISVSIFVDYTFITYSCVFFFFSFLNE